MELSRQKASTKERQSRRDTSEELAAEGEASEAVQCRTRHRDEALDKAQGSEWDGHQTSERVPYDHSIYEI